jgi:hypothetical protein
MGRRRLVSEPSHVVDGVLRFSDHVTFKQLIQGHVSCGHQLAKGLLGKERSTTH